MSGPPPPIGRIPERFLHSFPPVNQSGAAPMPPGHGPVEAGGWNALAQLPPTLQPGATLRHQKDFHHQAVQHSTPAQPQVDNEERRIVELIEQKLPELGLSDFSDSLRHPILMTLCDLGILDLVARFVDFFITRLLVPRCRTGQQASLSRRVLPHSGHPGVGTSEHPFYFVAPGYGVPVENVGGQWVAPPAQDRPLPVLAAPILVMCEKKDAHPAPQHDARTWWSGGMNDAGRHGVIDTRSRVYVSDNDRVALVGPHASHRTLRRNEIEPYVVWTPASTAVPNPSHPLPRSVRYALTVGHPNGATTHAVVDFDAPLGAFVRVAQTQAWYETQRPRAGHQGRAAGKTGAEVD